jgi:hypothetical protein
MAAAPPAGSGNLPASTQDAIRGIVDAASRSPTYSWDALHQLTLCDPKADPSDRLWNPLDYPDYNPGTPSGEWGPNSTYMNVRVGLGFDISDVAMDIYRIDKAMKSV